MSSRLLTICLGASERFNSGGAWLRSGGGVGAGGGRAFTSLPVATSGGPARFAASKRDDEERSDERVSDHGRASVCTSQAQQDDRARQTTCESPRHSCQRVIR